MKSATKPPYPDSDSSWRSIRQDVKSGAMSRKGRRRRLVAWSKVATFSLLAAAAGWGIYTVIYSWENDRMALTTAVHSEPVKEVVLLTGGVLTKQWVIDTMALPKKINLMALELPMLRDKLLASGQVSVAVITRNFPDTLVVTLQERSPVARIYDHSYDAKEWLVAKDGTVYEGFNYDKNLLASLPVLDGVELRPKGKGFQPIAGMDEISSLLSTAQLQAPHLYREWLMVSMEKFNESDEIYVQTKRVPRVVFSRKLDFFKQIARLDYIIDRINTTIPESMFKSVNLTIENQVPVELVQTPDELAGTKPSSQKLPQRKGKRDL